MKKPNFSQQQIEVLSSGRYATLQSGFYERYNTELRTASNMWRLIATKAANSPDADHLRLMIDNMSRAEQADTLIGFRAKKVQSLPSILGGVAKDIVFVFKIDPEKGIPIPDSEVRVGDMEDETASIGFTPEDVVLARRQLEEQQQTKLNF